MKKKFLLVSGAAALALSAVALTSCGNKPYDDKGALAVCLASTPDYVDPALNSSVDGATYAVHAFAGLVRYTPVNGKLTLQGDLAKELPVAQTEEDGKVSYTFELRDGIKFSDGTDIKASDVVKSWNRAAGEELAADYGYMFEVIDGYGTEKLNVVANDEAATVKVTLPVDVPYFYELCAFPAYAVLKDADKLDNEGKWAKDPKKFVGSGAYTLGYYKKDVKLVMEKNEYYWDTANTTQEKIKFVFSDDTSAMYAQYTAGELQLIDDLDKDIVNSKKNSADYHVIGQLGTYYMCFNTNKQLFGDKTEKQNEEIRKALSLLIDRNTITNVTTGLGETPSTGFVGAGLTDAIGGEFVDHNGPNQDGKGWTQVDKAYADNVKDALDILGKYYTVENGKVKNFPTINYMFNTNSGHQKIAEAVQAQFREVGITMNVSNEDWAQFLQDRKKGQYEVARNGWVSDYNDPMSFLDMWTTESGNNDAQLGKGTLEKYDGYSIDVNVGNITTLSGTWAETYDVLISAAKTEANQVTRFALMHKAEELLMDTGALAPIYNYVDNWLQSTKLENVYASPLGYKYFMYSTTK